MADLKNEIEKYLRGELGPGEMHALEKKALSDPFLAEALEGAATIDAKEFLEDVAGLQKRIAQKRRQTWITPLRIAAALGLLLVASYILYLVVKPKDDLLLTQKSDEKTFPLSGNLAGDSASESSKEKTKNGLLSLSQPAPVQQKRNAETDAGPGPATQGAAGSTASPADEVKSGAVPDSVEAEVQRQDLAAIKSDEPVAAKPEEKAPGDRQDDTTKDKAEPSIARRSRDIQGFAAAPPLQRVITGKVTATEDNMPLPGVNVVVKGTSQGSVTDANGNYQLVTGAGISDLVFSFIGYESTEVNLPADQAQKDVKLSTDVSQLSEVIVVGYGSSKKEDDGEPAPMQLAEPQGGRRAYKKYLDNSLQYPPEALEQKIEGRVTLEFVVRTDGGLTDFNVIHGLGAGCNEEVIRLVREGPHWRPSRQADIPLESQVRIRVRFKLPK